MEQFLTCGKAACSCHQGQKPSATFEDRQRGRQEQLWEVKDLDFSEGYGGKD
jgi:hypothetical protein